MPQSEGNNREEPIKYRILMARWPKTNEKMSNNHKHRPGALTTRLKYLQINLQHSRLATDNLLKTIAIEGMDIACIQEPYIIGNKIGGIPYSITVLTNGERKKRTAIGNNKNIDALGIT
jgi:small neutral amino acid transporter SnatA (MarC family)